MIKRAPFFDGALFILGAVVDWIIIEPISAEF
jgi:hypothetical protein